jgi:hypothetical protein
MNRELEHQLLFAVARRDADEVCRLAQTRLDWDYVFATAFSHGLVPLLQKHLSAFAGDVAPGHVLARLKRESIANSQSVLHLVGKQLNVYRFLKEHGIPVAIFKGAVLAQMAYGELSLRQAGDIDVLIHRRDFAGARSLLESLGYEMMPRLTEAQLASHLAFHCEIPFMRDDWFTVVDLHWGLAPRSFVFGVEPDEVMSRLQPVSLAGTMIDTFSIEDMVLYQTMHGAKHLWHRLEWIISLAELVRASEVDWGVVIDRAEAAHATRMLALGLRLVEAFTDVPMPAQIDPDGVMKRLAAQIQKEIFLVSHTIHSTETNLYNFKIMDRKRDAIVSALRALFVPTLPDWEALALPTPLHSLYYAFRPLRLSKTYLWYVLNRRWSRTN